MSDFRFCRFVSQYDRKHAKSNPGLFTSPNSTLSSLLSPYTYTHDFVAGLCAVRLTALVVHNKQCGWPIGLTHFCGAHCALLPPIIRFLVLPAALTFFLIGPFTFWCRQSVVTFSPYIHVSTCYPTFLVILTLDNETTTLSCNIRNSLLSVVVSYPRRRNILFILSLFH
jgi:hypothetical protein